MPIRTPGSSRLTRPEFSMRCPALIGAGIRSTRPYFLTPGPGTSRPDVIADGLASGGRSCSRQPAPALDLATDKLIDGRALEQMKPQAVLINTSRGGIITPHSPGAAKSTHRRCRTGRVRRRTRRSRQSATRSEQCRRDAPRHLVHRRYDASVSTAAIDNCRRLRDGQPLMNVVGSGQEGLT